MITLIKILESVPCNKVHFPMLHSLSCLAPCYIADSISHQQELILSNSNQNESLMRIENLTKKQIQAISDNLRTWSYIHLIVFLNWLALANFRTFSISELSK